MNTAGHSNTKLPSNFTVNIYKYLFSSNIKTGKLGIKGSGGISYIGDGDLIATITPPSLFQSIRLFMRPNYNLPLFYTRGYWSCDNDRLYYFLEALTSKERRIFQKLFDLFNKNMVNDQIVYKLFPAKVRKNIAIHYNTSPDFMRLILGDTLEYTCAFFDESNSTLSLAQNNKVNTVIDRLGIEAAHNVLDFGCGWGQIAEAVSRKVGCKVTGLSISSNQIKYANSVKSQNTNFIESDFHEYNSLQKFDRIYSIGMLEHVGRGLLGGYFSKINNLLSTNGAALIHCIVREEKGSTNRWIDEFVFPGAYIPQLSEVVSEIEKSDLQVKKIYTHDKSNYYKTMRSWTENFYENFNELKCILDAIIGKEDSMQAMKIWEFYLCGSTLVFNKDNGYCRNVQMIISRKD